MDALRQAGALVLLGPLLLDPVPRWGAQTRLGWVSSKCEGGTLCFQSGEKLSRCLVAEAKV